MLEIDHLQVNYGAITALKGVSLKVEEKEVVALIGANGAGKSTLLRTISGLLRPVAGSIHFQGRDLKQSTPQQLVAMGIAHVPEGRRIFASLTVKENLRLGAYLRHDRANVKEERRQLYQRLPVLGERKKQLAGTLSGGEQQMLAIARAMLMKPRLLLLDEPSLGLAPIVVQQIFTLLREIHANGCTLLLIEQNANLALRFASRAYVIESGAIVMHDTAANLLKNPQVQQAYLG